MPSGVTCLLQAGVAADNHVPAVAPHVGRQPQARAHVEALAAHARNGQRARAGHGVRETDVDRIDVQGRAVAGDDEFGCAAHVERGRGHVVEQRQAAGTQREAVRAGVQGGAEGQRAAAGVDAPACLL